MECHAETGEPAFQRAAAAAGQAEAAVVEPDFRPETGGEQTPPPLPPVHGRRECRVQAELRSSERTTLVPAEPEPVLEEQRLVLEEPEPVLGEQRLVSEETEPVLEEQQLVSEKAEPVLEEQLVLEELEPVLGEQWMVSEETEPVLEEQLLPEETEPVLEEQRLVLEKPALVLKEQPLVPEEPDNVLEEQQLVPEEPEPVPKEQRLVSEEPESVLKEQRLVLDQHVLEEQRLVPEEPEIVLEEQRLVLEDRRNSPTSSSMLEEAEPVLEETEVVLQTANPVYEEQLEVLDEAELEKDEEGLSTDGSVLVTEQPVTSEEAASTVHDLEASTREPTSPVPEELAQVSEQTLSAAVSTLVCEEPASVAAEDSPDSVSDTACICRSDAAPVARASESGVVAASVSCCFRDVCVLTPGGTQGEPQVRHLQEALKDALLKCEPLLDAKDKEEIGTASVTVSAVQEAEMDMVSDEVVTEMDRGTDEGQQQVVECVTQGVLTDESAYNGSEAATEAAQTSQDCAVASVSGMKAFGSWRGPPQHVTGYQEASADCAQPASACLLVHTVTADSTVPAATDAAQAENGGIQSRDGCREAADSANNSAENADSSDVIPGSFGDGPESSTNSTQRATLSRVAWATNADVTTNNSKHVHADSQNDSNGRAASNASPEIFSPTLEYSSNDSQTSSNCSRKVLSVSPDSSNGSPEVTNGGPEALNGSRDAPNSNPEVSSICSDSPNSGESISNGDREASKSSPQLVPNGSSHVSESESVVNDSSVLTASCSPVSRTDSSAEYAADCCVSGAEQNPAAGADADDDADSNRSRSPLLEKSASCPLIDETCAEPAGSRRRRVSFPEGDVAMVTGYIEPRNPLCAMYNASPEAIAAAYRQSCAKHACRPLPAVLRQIAALPVIGDRVESFSLRGVPLCRAQCESLEEVFKKVQFNLVDVAGCGLDDDSAAALFEMVEFYDSALAVSFGGNRLGVRGWQAGCRMVKASVSLERLSAEGVELCDQSAAALGRSLRLSHSLRVLHLEGCRLHGRPMALLMAGLRQGPALRELYLGENELGTGDGSMLGNMLKLNLRLDLMDLRINQFDNDSVGFMLEALAQQSTTARGDGLVSLNLWCNQFTVKSAGYLASLLQLHTSLDTLNLGRNAVGDETVRVIKQALMTNTSVRRLGLQQCRLTCEGAVALAEILADNAALRRVDLRGNAVRVGGLLALARALEHNSQLVQLDLDPAGDDPERQLLQARVRALCDDNRQRQQAEADDEQQRSDSLLRRLSAAWRRVSLTCDAPAAAAAAAAAVAAAAAAPAAAAADDPPPPVVEERRRLVSPSPSPTSSPLPSPSRSRFRVFRVSADDGGALQRPARSSSESDASGGSSSSSSSASPSPQRAARGFRVTRVVESPAAATARPRPGSLQ